jgi:uncharacterized protein YciI
MFVLLSHYRKPLTEVDRFLGEHREFLQRHYASGHFLMSGRQEPRTGGVILAQAGSRTEITGILQEDPFHREGIAEYQIIEFFPTMAAPELTDLKTA